jgi:ferredoxin-NADP reductase/nitrite reductase/ring-hydroxylating ferredoxin subunit
MATAERSGFQKVANSKDLKEGGLLAVDVKDKRIVLARVSGNVYAMDAVCSHEGGPLEDGTLTGYELKCPWHYAVFDVRSGKVSDQTVWATSLSSYPVRVDERSGDILLLLEEKKQQDEAAKQKGADKKDDMEESERKYYEQEERNAGTNKLELELLSKHKTQGTDMMTFKLTRGAMNFKAGQFAFFKLDGVTGDSKGPIRHFSIASSPTESEYLLISTRIRDTPYKQKLASLSDGTKIVTWGPQGEFVLQEDKPAVFLSGGIGVTPFRSMIKYATDKKLPTKIVVFDSNRNAQNILYKEEFDTWAQENNNLKIIYTITDEEDRNQNEKGGKQPSASSTASWKGERGRIDKAMVEKYLKKEELASSIFYICGPPGMLKAMQDLLKKELNIPKERIKVEEFTGY